MAADPAEASASASASTAAPAPTPVPAETVLITLHTLLRAHVAAHPSPTLPYLHPYAPAPRAAWKGKARASLPGAEEQAAALRRVKEAVEGARGVLARGRDDKERVRAARAMREVITHESALLPLGSTLLSLPPAMRPLAALAPLPPADLLPALGRRLGLQVFAEDSQFGLLKTSLTLAGERFVVDIDLEADAGEDEDEGGTEPPSAAATPGLGQGLAMTAVEATPAPSAPPPPSERGKVRLAKLSANHVTPSGADGKSEHVARVLRAALDAHLTAWNAHEGQALEGACAALEGALAELKALDDLAAAGDATSPDLFADLEALAAGVARLGAEGALHEASGTMFPSFRILAAGRHNPKLRIRPVAKGEHVPPPWADEGMAVDAVPVAADAAPAAAAAADDAMAVDGAEVAAAVDTTNGAAAAADTANGSGTAADTSAGPAPAPDTMCAGAWLLEVVDDAPTPAPGGGRGLIVRRTWLQPGADDTDASAWNGSIKAEGLLYQLALEASGAAAPLPLFPQSSEFVHRPEGGFTQRWNLAFPGPEGYVVGRVGLPASWGEFARLVRALRAQLVLDELFASAFPPSAVADDIDDGGELDDLDAAPTSLGVTATLSQRALRVSLPYSLAEPESPMLTLELAPADDAPYVAALWSAPGLDEAQRARVDAAVGPVASLDAVAFVAAVSAALTAA
ncbi:hypothetical protein Q8F55_001113 [Vanrija albida]|uniref:Mediator of RNA polymerase II transcription subunit 1 n=1 Tax=Vanrija albida TaxID=181172 RepID=A0ABR3QF63_9TREE